jgi:hypothetical protein
MVCGYCGLRHYVQISHVAHPVSYQTNRAVSQVVKWLDSEANHSPTSSAEVQKAWKFISIFT